MVETPVRLGNGQRVEPVNVPPTGRVVRPTVAGGRYREAVIHAPHAAGSTYERIIQYKRLTWGRAAVVALAVMLWALFFIELPPARDELTENRRGQLRLVYGAFAVLSVFWARSVIRRRHEVGAQLYEAGALPPSSPWPTIAASILAALIGAAAALLS